MVEGTDDAGGIGVDETSGSSVAPGTAVGNGGVIGGGACVGVGLGPAAVQLARSEAINANRTTRCLYFTIISKSITALRQCSTARIRSRTSFPN